MGEYFLRVEQINGVSPFKPQMAGFFSMIFIDR